jgi:hypothetical protein
MPPQTITRILAECGNEGRMTVSEITAIAQVPMLQVIQALQGNKDKFYFEMVNGVLHWSRNV